MFLGFSLNISFIDFIVVVFFGILPAILWLLYYLQKDVHPESNKMILGIFFLGILVAFPIILVELGFTDFLNEFFIPPFLATIMYGFVSIALVEEFFKYLVVRLTILKNEAFDEPVDAMIYMIIVGLGFAAIENVLYLWPKGLEATVYLGQTISFSATRFLLSTFLHALASATVGYFLALSLCQTKNRTWLIVKGLLIATALHGLFNFFIMKSWEKSNLYYMIPVIILLIGFAIFVSYGFKKLKKLESVCKIK